jgi:hypothetical protein
MQARTPSLLARLVVVVIMVAVSFVGPGSHPSQAEATGSYFYDFEQTLSPWQGRADPGVNGYSLTRKSGDSACPLPPEGNWYANLAITSTTIISPGVWMLASYTETIPVSVDVKFKAKAQSKCLGPPPCQVLAFVGTTEPTSSSQFAVVGTITNTWSTYSYSASASPTSTLYVALGWKDATGASNITGEVGYDCVDVNIKAITAQPSP